MSIKKIFLDDTFIIFINSYDEFEQKQVWVSFSLSGTVKFWLEVSPSKERCAMRGKKG